MTQEADQDDPESHHIPPSATPPVDHALDETITQLVSLIQGTITSPIEQFVIFSRKKEESKRIRLVTIPIQAANAADRIAAVIGKERSADRPLLTGLMKDCAIKSTDNIRRRLQSLETVVRNNKQKLHTIKNPTKPPHKKSKNGPGNSKTARSLHLPPPAGLAVAPKHSNQPAINPTNTLPPATILRKHGRRHTAPIGDTNPLRTGEKNVNDTSPGLKRKPPRPSKRRFNGKQPTPPGPSPL